MDKSDRRRCVYDQREHPHCVNVEVTLVHKLYKLTQHTRSQKHAHCLPSLTHLLMVRSLSHKKKRLLKVLKNVLGNNFLNSLNVYINKCIWMQLDSWNRWQDGRTFVCVVVWSYVLTHVGLWGCEGGVVLQWSLILNRTGLQTSCGWKNHRVMLCTAAFTTATNIRYLPVSHYMSFLYLNTSHTSFTPLYSLIKGTLGSFLLSFCSANFHLF